MFGKVIRPSHFAIRIIVQGSHVMIPQNQHSLTPTAARRAALPINVVSILDIKLRPDTLFAKGTSLDSK